MEWFHSKLQNMQIENAAMDLLINALADMKKKDINFQLENELIGAFRKIQSPVAEKPNSNMQTQQNIQTINKLQLDNNEDQDFDTTLTNDFDSMTELANTLKSQSATQTVIKQQQNDIQQNQKKFKNFKQKPQQSDEYEAVKIIQDSEEQKPITKNYVFKNTKTTSSTVNETPQVKQQSQQPSQSNVEQKTSFVQQVEQKHYKFKQPKIVKEQIIQTDKMQFSGNVQTTLHQKDSQQQSQQQPQPPVVQPIEKQKNIIQIIQIVGKQHQPKQKQHKQKQEQNIEQMKIKEVIVPKVKKARKIQEKAEDIAAIVAAEYDKQWRKFQEEEGNKSVPTNELRDLSALINEKPVQQVQKKPVPLQKQESTDEISTGEIWPCYDKKSAEKLQEKGRGVGAWDRSVSFKWDLLDEVSEGEVHIFKQQQQEEGFIGYVNE